MSEKPLLPANAAVAAAFASFVLVVIVRVSSRAPAIVNGPDAPAELRPTVLFQGSKGLLFFKYLKILIKVRFLLPKFCLSSRCGKLLLRPIHTPAFRTKPHGIFSRGL
jgi:hypothetical protein